MKYTPKHAIKALEIVERLLPQVSLRDEYVELVSILRDPQRWNESHAQFYKIRTNITLVFEEERVRTLDYYFVFVAENAAKTAYNCSGGDAPFDEDSFDWLLRCEREFLSHATITRK